MRSVRTVFRLGIKEIFSLLHDPVLMGLVVYIFTFGIYSVADNVQTEVNNAAIAIVDEDRSVLSQRIRSAFLQPHFKPAAIIDFADIDKALDDGLYSFVLTIPPRFQADVQAGHRPTLGLSVDATAMTLAGNGAAYIENIIQAELLKFQSRAEPAPELPVELEVRASFNPNLHSVWFMAVMQLTNNITVMAIILAGAAVIRERERGTIEHLLVMPVRPTEIMLAKIWANGLMIVTFSVLSIYLVVGGLLGVTIAGSVALFAVGSALYLFSVTALGIMLSTIARTMPQFGLLSIPVFVVLNMLSGGQTPMEAMPATLQAIMQAAPSTHYYAFAQAVLFRGAGIGIVWPHLLAITAIGSIFFGYALLRFRNSLSAAR